MIPQSIIRRMFPAALATLALSGCLSTAKSIVTAPVRVASKSVDLMTTSQSEADEKRGRDMRHREERLDDVEKSYARHLRQCQNGNQDACYTARNEYGEIQNLRAGLPPR